VQGFGPWTFYQSWYVLLIFWLFVIIPIIICVLYVYESSTVRKYRQIYWKRFVAYVRKRFIRTQTSDVGEASPDVPHVEATAGSGKSSIASKTSSSHKV
jgi:cytochrome c biogenesis protein ResB